MYTNKQIWSVSYPILLSLLAQNVINVTDTAFLGRVSEIALGASAMGGLFYICIFTIAFGFRWSFLSGFWQRQCDSYCITAY